MGIFSSKPSIRVDDTKKKELPEGLWLKCPGCEETVHKIELEQNSRVCPKCDHHFAQSARERIGQLLDPGSFEEMDAAMQSVDTLEFKGVATYANRLKSYQEKTGLIDAVTSGMGSIESQRLGIAVMDFAFLAATMGSVVGEKSRA